MTISTKSANDVRTEGNKLRYWLTFQVMTQAELSRVSGIGKQVINRIVNGHPGRISSVTAELICRTLLLPISEVFPNGAKR